jgi:hypothetical protein
LHSLSAELPLPPPEPAQVGPARIAFGDLEQLRVVGTGQFGLVRLVRHRATGEPFALKASASQLKLCMPLLQLACNRAM